MRFLVTEKLGPHKFKTPEGYLICTDAILSRTGKQEYKRCELFGDACEDADNIVNVERTDDEVFSDKAMASFENKAVCIEHPDHDVNAENHNELAVGFVRDIHKGEDNGKPVMMGTLVITDKDAVEAVESGEYKELSCGYDCDIDDDDEPRQRNIRGNHVALCKQGRAGVARIVDSKENSMKIYKVTLNADKFPANEVGHIIHARANSEVEAKKKAEEYFNSSYKVSERTKSHPKYKGQPKFTAWKVEEDMKAEIGNYFIIDAYDIDDSKTVNDEDWAAGFKKSDGSYTHALFEAYDKNRAMEYAEGIAKKNGWKFVSLQTAREYLTTTDSVDDVGIKVWQVRQGYAIVVKRYWKQYGRNAFVDATESSIEAARYRRGSLERNDKMEFVIVDCNDGQYKIEDEAMKDIQATKTPGTDNITIEVKDGAPVKVDKVAYKQGAFSVLEATSRHGKIYLVVKNYNGENPYSGGGTVTFNINEAKRIIESYETMDKLNSKYGEVEGYRRWMAGKKDSIDVVDMNADAIEISVSELGVKQVGNGDIVTYKGKRYTVFQTLGNHVALVSADGKERIIAKITDSSADFKAGYRDGKAGTYDKWYRYNRKDGGKEYERGIKKAISEGFEVKNFIDIRDSKEQLFTIEYEQDDVMYVRKVRANSIGDAISKVKDDSHKVVVFTNQVLNELGKNNSNGKYDRVVQAMRWLFSESLHLPDNELKTRIHKKVLEYFKKFVKE